jgi:hypothetical protein
MEIFCKRQSMVGKSERTVSRVLVVADFRFLHGIIARELAYRLRMFTRSCLAGDIVGMGQDHCAGIRPGGPPRIGFYSRSRGRCILC